MAEPPTPCAVCGGGPTRHYAIMVDGEPLRPTVHLCQLHGDQYLLRAGEAMGRMLLGGRAGLGG